MPGLSSGIDSRLEARFSASGARVRRASPLELRGPFLRDAARSYYLRNVTAGIFAGDAYQVEAAAEAGASVRIASSSATKVHSMPDGSANFEVELTAAAGSSLAWGPHTTILQGESSLRQGLRVMLEAGARVYLAEVLVLGRLARGESCVFTRFESSLAVRQAVGVLSSEPPWPGAASPADHYRTLYEENYVLVPGQSLATALGGFGAVVSVYALGVGKEAKDCLRGVLECGGNHAGVTLLPNDAGVLLRGLAPSLSSGQGLAEAALEALLSA